MVIALGMPPTESAVVAMDSSGQVLTFGERVDHLYQTGYCFEATVSQMTLVEALQLLYLLAKVQIGEAKVSQDVTALRQAHHLNFGKAKTLLIGSGCLQNASIERDLHDYVDRRNEMAHSLIASFSAQDLAVTFAIGQRLIRFFHAYLLALSKRNAA